MSEIIGVKQLYKELNTISQRVTKGESFIIVKRSKPVFRIIPYKETPVKKYTLKDLEKLQFRSRDKKLSQKIDEIVYK